MMKNTKFNGVVDFSKKEFNKAKQYYSDILVLERKIGLYSWVIVLSILTFTMSVINSYWGDSKNE